MKKYYLGQKNDCKLYAIEVKGQYVPLTAEDLEFEDPDAIIYYDSGIYPGITDLDGYMCSRCK